MLAACTASASRIWRSSAENAGDAARVEIEHAEQLAALMFGAGVGGGARRGIQRNGDNRAQTLNDDALGGLQIEAGQVQVFSDDGWLVC